MFAARYFRRNFQHEPLTEINMDMKNKLTKPAEMTVQNAPKIGLVIGQAPPAKIYAIPFSGTRLYKWFNLVGIDQNIVINNFDFDALVSTFPGKTSGGDRPPTEEEVLRHIPILLKKIEDNKFSLIIPIGKLAIQYILNNRKIELHEAVGKKFYRRPFGRGKHNLTIIPLPHPSGLNRWSFNERNRNLLYIALDLIKKQSPVNTFNSYPSCK